ncbi:MAG TPA: sigma-70 family RNA polymerase sigma factor [Oligoflexus sp.]|uniref:sigma-70 family RNA polymerase sigma factor n=1 Tax=Oligoflexus sp. TaxID=1971216 RepID=UPI002D732F1B|nr:sigma-70 family RNA polymerase sigma factor [Oligoflexus sp.]HYX32871.1 sigma-70 family RNA polymerase sigma factor [Oligoflexus sp.]
MAIISDRGARWAILLLAAQQADEAAYRLLLKELSLYLQHFLRHKLGPHPDSDDVIQEILIAVHKARHTFDGTRSFLPWFHAIVRYKTIDFLRHKKRIQVHEIPDEKALEQYSETLTGLQSNTLDDELLHALASLPPKQRQAVELMKIEGLSAKEAAIRMGMTEVATKVSAHRAYEALRHKLMREKQ